VLAFNLSYLFDRTELLRAGMDRIIQWIEAGKLRPPEVTVFPFSQVADAHRAIESGRTTGKLILKV
jgi:NADPH:quinone reductase-like Zn-dependent oxidoreductase